MNLPKLKWIDIVVMAGVLLFLAIMLIILRKLDADTLQCLTDPINYTMEQTGLRCFCMGK